MNKLLLATMAIVTTSAHAYTVETVTIKGAESDIEHNATVVLPDGYSNVKNYNVIYVLHGAHGTHLDWTANSDIEILADKFDVIIVNPDAGGNNWYVDSTVTGNEYGTYITKDVVTYIDNSYSTNKDRSGRAITGLSMGGIGALNIAINNKNIFGTAGSMSGSVDIQPLSNSSGKIATFGELSDNKQAWEDYAIINQLHKITSGNSKFVYNGEPIELPIIFDVGADDFVYSMNKRLHEEMLNMNIQHDFIVRPGNHNWDYWKNAITYQIQFLTDNMK